MTAFIPGGDDLLTVSFDTTQMRALQRFCTNAYYTAARRTVERVTRESELKLEAATEAAGLGRLSRAWASKVYPESGLAAAPTGTIFPNGRDRTLGALRAYSQGANITGRRGQYMAIPLRAAGPRYFGRGKKPLTPEEWIRRTGLTLKLIKVKGALYLATDGVVGKKTGFIAKKGTKRRLAEGRKVETLFIFRLVKQVRVAKRFDIRAELSGTPSRLRSTFVDEANALLSPISDGG